MSTSPGADAQACPHPSGYRAPQHGADAVIIAVVVTHKRLEPLRTSLDVVCRQTYPVAHVIVVDNAAEDAVRELVEGLPTTHNTPSTYLPSQHNLGGAGGFALGMLHALALGADYVWLADDDGRPEDKAVLETLRHCAATYGLDEVSPVVADIDDPTRLAFPLRRGLVWRRLRAELVAGDGDGGGAGGSSGGTDLLPGIASLFNGALFSAECLFRVGVPDLRLFIRGDEVEIHRRLVRSGAAFGTCLSAAYLHPGGAAEFKPILGGRMHTQYPDDERKRFFTYRNRGYLLTQPGMRKLVPQEILRFGWYFLVSRKDPAGFAAWARLQRRGAAEDFRRP